MFVYMVSVLDLDMYFLGDFFGSGESEYWLATVKVVLIVLFILVGLIYDWGGVKNHPGPVRLFIQHR